MSYHDQKRLKKERKATGFASAQTQLAREQLIVKAYDSGDFLTRQIAQNFGITTRQVQRICKRWGVIRSQSAGASVAGPLTPKSRITNPDKPRGKGKDHQIGSGVFRDMVIYTLKMQGRKFTHCEWCGKKFHNGKYQLHHTKYDGATVDDLMIVCQQCNLIPANRFLD